MATRKVAKIITGLLLAGIITAPAAYAYDVNNPPPQYGTNDPGVQLNRTREYMERQRVARQIAEDRAKQRAEVPRLKAKRHRTSRQPKAPLNLCLTILKSNKARC